MMPNRRKTDRMKNVATLVSTVLGLTGIAAIVFYAGKTSQQVENLVSGQGRMVIQQELMMKELADHSVKLKVAELDRGRAEEKVQIVAEALVRRNTWSNKASDDIVRRLDALNHKGTAVLEDRP